MSSTDANREPVAGNALLPAGFYHPLHLLWLAVLPLLALWAINAHTVWLVYDEIDEDQQQWANRLLWLNGGFALGVAALSFALTFLKRRLDVLALVILLITGVLFIWGDVTWLGNIMSSLGGRFDWMLDSQYLILAQFSLVMPLCFYALLGIACRPLNIKRWLDISGSSGLLVGVPVFWYLIGNVMARHFPLVHRLNSTVVIILFIVSAALMFVGLFRLLTRLYHWLGQYRFILILITALAMPLGGLILNRKIPFPVDFQLIAIYVWTIVNGGLLLLGCLPRLRDNRWLWLAQCASFPFTVYFFAVFLPFMALFLPALLAFGAGFLILSPTILFLLHGQILLRGFAGAGAIWGNRRAALLAVGVFLLTPAWFFAQASLDRYALHSAMDFVYQPRLYPRQTLTVGPRRVSRTLLKLNASQSGKYLPILTAFYNWRVFDNLQLPDSKLAELYFAFSGEKLPEPEVDKERRFGFFGRDNRATRAANARRPIEFSRDQITVVSETVTRDDGDCRCATLTLNMTNHTDRQNEYVAKLRLSPAVMVSGLRLVIDGEKVDGRLFEQKTALWIYQQIRDRQRRDPALLRYTGDDEIELRVFPLERRQTREVEIEFIYPKKSGATVEFGGNNILPAADDEIVLLTATDFSGSRAMVTLNTGAPAVERQPYTHFIIERSAATAARTAASLLEEIRANTFNAEGKITFANFESKLMTPQPVPVASLDVGQLEKMTREFPARGGFLPEKVLREEIIAHENSMRRDRPESFLRYPQFYFIGEEMEIFSPRAAGGYTVINSSPFMEMKPGRRTRVFREFYYPDWEGTGKILPMPNRSFIIAAGERVHTFIRLRRAFVAMDKGLEFYVKKDGFEGFMPVSPENISVVENETYKLGARVFALQDELDRDPSRAARLLPLLVKQSRESGIMVPATAYIVVERGIHWKILSEKEKQKLGANQALELEADVVPEPSLFALLAAGAVGLLLWRMFSPTSPGAGGGRWRLGRRSLGTWRRRR